MPRLVDHDARRTELAAAACQAIFRYAMDSLKPSFKYIELSIQK